VDRVPIGLPALDQVLAGGLPRGTLTLLTGVPGSGKSILSRLFLHKGVASNEDGFLVLTSESKESVLEGMRQFRWGGENAATKLHFLDCYSWRSGEKKLEYSAQLSALTEVSLELGRMLDEFQVTDAAPSRLVLDTYTDFIRYAGEDRALRLLDTVRLRARRRGITGLLLLEEWGHEPRVVSAVESSTDGTIRMKLDEQGRYIMVSRMTATPVSPRWIQFVIG